MKTSAKHRDYSSPHLLTNAVTTLTNSKSGDYKVLSSLPPILPEHLLPSTNGRR